jgi:mono/diheme cytochrome c family protein
MESTREKESRMTRIFLAVALGLAAVVAVLPSADAQNPACYNYRGVPAAPVVVQHQQYNQHHDQNYYQIPVQKVVVNDVAVAPLVVTVPVDSKAVHIGQYGVPYYYSVGDAYREKAFIRQVIREELQAFAAGNVPQPNAQQPGVGQQPAPPQKGNTQPAVEQDVVDDVTPPDLQQKVLAAYAGKGNCLACHGNGQASGKFRLTNETGQLLKKSSDKRWKIYGMASVGAMPPAAANDASKAMEAANLPVLLQYAAIK